MAQNVRTERSGAVVTVILDRPEARNAVDREIADALSAAFLAFERDDTAKIAVLWGAGGHFCSGADLKAIAAGHGNRRSAPTGEALDASAPMGPTRLKLSKPVIAAVDGYAVAGGLELACWCDLRVAGEDAVFWVFCRRFGVPLIDGGTLRLPRLIGESRALDMILTGRAVPAAEALTFGLVNRLAPAGTARAEAVKLAAALASLPQSCLRSDRLSVYEQSGLPLEAALAREFARGEAILNAGEAQAGAARFAAGSGRGGDFGDS